MRSLMRGSLLVGVAIAVHSSWMRRHLRTQFQWDKEATAVPKKRRCGRREADIRKHGGLAMRDPLRPYDPSAPSLAWPGGDLLVSAPRFR